MSAALRCPNDRSSVAVGVVLIFSALAATASAQTSVLAGTWERVSALTATGTPETPLVPALLIVSADGHFTFSSIPASRPKINKPLDQLTREELLERYKGLTVRQGTWSVTENRFVTVELGAESPNVEGREVVRLFRMEGDVLVLSSPNPLDKTENRWRRMASGARLP